MAIPVYAVEADYTGLYGDGSAPANVDQLLRSASRLVRRETATAVYYADTNTGLPTDSAIAAAFREATCAQVHAWIAAGITDPAAGGFTTKGVVSSKSLDGASVSYDTSLSSSVTTWQARQAITDTLCPEAADILRDAVGDSAVWTYG